MIRCEIRASELATYAQKDIFLKELSINPGRSGNRMLQVVRITRQNYPGLQIVASRFEQTGGILWSLQMTAHIRLRFMHVLWHYTKI